MQGGLQILTGVWGHLGISLQLGFRVSDAGFDEGLGFGVQGLGQGRQVSEALRVLKCLEEVTRCKVS